VQAGPRSTKPEDVAQYLPQAHKFADILAGWEAAKRDVEEGDVIVVCGSFFTVAPVLNALNSASE